MREVDRILPYDARLDVRDLRDLQKLRAIPDRDIAQLLLELRDATEAYERSPGFEARERARAAAKVKRDVAWRKEIADDARRGVYGVPGKELWNTITGKGTDTSDGALQELAKALRGKPRKGVAA